LSLGDWALVGFSARMALAATLALLAPGLALAWLLARREFPGKALLETAVTLPLVLPPVATGLVLLELLGRRGLLGRPLASAGLDVVFTWRAVVVAMAVMSLPLLVQTARAAFANVEPRLEQVARTLGAGEWRVFRTVTLPLARRGVAAGTLLAFARALGEFGATIVVAGNIPGRTTTLSTAIWQHVQLGDDRAALRLAAIAAGLAFAAVLLARRMARGARP
jgi:molybdate transport system permease protein